MGTINALNQSEFEDRLRNFLSPSTVIVTPERLYGRERHLREIRQALIMPGRQAFIYGFRGVGKSSLAATAAYQAQSSDKKPLFIACESSTSVACIVQDVAQRALSQDPTERQRQVQRGMSLRLPGIGGQVAETLTHGSIPEIDSINDAILILEFISRSYSEDTIIVIDEFDQVKDPFEQNRFGQLVKQIGDQNINIKLIFAGIGESIDELMDAHASVPRYFHHVELPPLGISELLPIVEHAADGVGVELDPSTKFRIVRISDGFPNFTHLICEKLFWRIFEDADRAMLSKPEHFKQSLFDAVGSIEPQLKRPYEFAIQKYTSSGYEHCLWAVADGHELKRQVSEIYASYQRILPHLEGDPLKENQFYARMNNLKSERHGSILQGNQAGWYEFREKVMRGYARLRAAQSSIFLGKEHPLDYVKK